MHAVDNGKVTVLLLDHSAAFDTVEHNILLSVVCNRFSIEDTTFDWFQSYLLDCQQSFVHNDLPISARIGVRTTGVYRLPVF